MSVRPIRVLVVDDSLLMREMIGDALRAAGLDVCGTARDGQEALTLAAQLQPDVVTLDVQMPKMDGLQTLDALLKSNPTPVIMVSSLTQRGAATTLDALDRGALDYVAKPENARGVDAALGEELVRKIRAMVGVDVRRMLAIRQQRAERQKSLPVRPAASSSATTLDAGLEFPNACIAIGISTGGPPALASLFQSLQPPLPPIVVVQHMPLHFTGPFAWRLNSLSKLDVKEAATGDVLEPNHVYIAPGGQHLTLRKELNQVKLRVRDGDPVSGHKPSVDVMMQSVAEVFGGRVLGVIMTGMGRDGADGCKYLRQAGGFVLGQDEATSDVYGMNKVAFVEGHVDKQFSLDDGPQAITAQARRLLGRRCAGAGA